MLNDFDIAHSPVLTFRIIASRCSQSTKSEVDHHSGDVHMYMKITNKVRLKETHQS